MLHKVRMFSANGQFLSLISVPKAPFTRPTDMVTLHSGQFVVRDDNKVIVFNSEGKFLRTLWQEGKFLCKVKLTPEARRPSGVVLDTENRELYQRLARLSKKSRS